MVTYFVWNFFVRILQKQTIIVVTKMATMRKTNPLAIVYTAHIGRTAKKYHPKYMYILIH